MLRAILIVIIHNHAFEMFGYIRRKGCMKHSDTIQKKKIVLAAIFNGFVQVIWYLDYTFLQDNLILTIRSGLSSVCVFGWCVIYFYCLFVSLCSRLFGHNLICGFFFMHSSCDSFCFFFFLSYLNTLDIVELFIDACYNVTADWMPINIRTDGLS